MLTQIIDTARRNHDTLAADAIGVAALVVMLVAGLHLPVLS
ncbi:hypothetical protein SAMN05216196_102466 [Lutimaribacter pacificus]|uniref:Uncharacterized protein n=1 Tax=Lutimaribacter pacificus TaxID=391948 RepID=A0A1H0F4N4_9RHOB|nr:hypothetical protein [Lutimaribacter pacificus]SDN89541.1 hypothetical protein SAMN05216196_102466 [Lutimaribacter pacificus]SHK44708.1 hypothetical protein SAMN05444142_105180 [Lutimaribacter pacificus]